MTREERNKLYDWLENGRVDIFLRRLMRERLAELEALISPYAEVMQYDRPERRVDA
jgi:hypothetical protein